MKLVTRYYIKDIRDFEDEGISILDLFKHGDIEALVKLVSLGNNNCSEEKSCEIIDNFIGDSHCLIDAFQVIKETLFGQKVDTSSEDDTKAKDYEFLSDIYSEYQMMLLSYDIAYSEFYSMSTSEMYRVVKGIKQKIIQDTNKKLAESHTQAALIGAAVWGKLGEVPKISDEDDEHKAKLAKTKSSLALRNFINKHEVI